ncbi:MAG TPA: hypothetical protein VFY71_12560 [Planctomycetota bacterium]|nr:hypothetical protein [Planctomycetota bacterium]
MSKLRANRSRALESPPRRRRRHAACSPRPARQGAEVDDPFDETVDLVRLAQDGDSQPLRTFDRFEMRDQGSFIDWRARPAEERMRDAADDHGALERAAGRKGPLAAARVAHRQIILRLSQLMAGG